MPLKTVAFALFALLWSAAPPARSFARRRRGRPRRSPGNVGGKRRNGRGGAEKSRLRVAALARLGDP